MNHFTAEYDPMLDEWAIYNNGDIFCHVSDRDFAIFEMKFAEPIDYESPWRTYDND